MKGGPSMHADEDQNKNILINSQAGSLGEADAWEIRTWPQEAANRVKSSSICYNLVTLTSLSSFVKE